MVVCANAAGYVDVGGDCADGDPRAHPGQTEPQSGTVTGKGGGDFDCNGKETKTWESVGGCFGPCSAGASGWVGAVAACGETGSYALDCNISSPTICSPVTSQRAQTCL